MYVDLIILICYDLKKIKEKCLVKLVSQKLRESFADVLMGIFRQNMNKKQRDIL